MVEGTKESIITAILRQLESKLKPQHFSSSYASVRLASSHTFYAAAIIRVDLRCLIAQRAVHSPIPDGHHTKLVHIVRHDFISDNQIVLHRLHLDVVRDIHRMCDRDSTECAINSGLRIPGLRESLTAPNMMYANQESRCASIRTGVYVNAGEGDLD